MRGASHWPAGGFWHEFTVWAEVCRDEKYDLALCRRVRLPRGRFPGEEIALSAGRGGVSTTKIPTIQEFAGTRRRQSPSRSRSDPGKPVRSQIARQMRESEQMSQAPIRHMMPDRAPSSMGVAFLGEPPRNAFAPAALRRATPRAPYVRKISFAAGSCCGKLPTWGACYAARDRDSGVRGSASGGDCKTLLQQRQTPPGRRPDRRRGRGARPGVTRRTEDRNECLT